MAGNLLPPSDSGAVQPYIEGGAPTPATPPPLPPMEPEGGMQLGRYIAAIKRYRWLILAVVVVGTGIGLLATRFIDPIYTDVLLTDERMILFTPERIDIHSFRP